MSSLLIRLLATGGVILLVMSCTSRSESSDGQRAQESSAAARSEIAELAAKVSYLSDREQIREVELHYMRGFDRKDEALMKSAFWPDAQINYQFKDIATSRSINEFFREDEAGHIKLSTHWGHLITNESMDVNGDVAYVESYVTELSSFKNGKSRIVSGRYIDRLDRRNGEWRIAVREFIPHFFTETDNALDAHWPVTGCGAGTWDKRDPSYRRPLTPRTQRDLGLLCGVR